MPMTTGAGGSIRMYSVAARAPVTASTAIGRRRRRTRATEARTIRSTLNGSGCGCRRSARVRCPGPRTSRRSSRRGSRGRGPRRTRGDGPGASGGRARSRTRGWSRPATVRGRSSGPASSPGRTGSSPAPRPADRARGGAGAWGAGAAIHGPRCRPASVGDEPAVAEHGPYVLEVASGAGRISSDGSRESSGSGVPSSRTLSRSAWRVVRKPGPSPLSISLSRTSSSSFSSTT